MSEATLLKRASAAPDVHALYQSVIALQPKIAARALSMERAGRLDDELVDELDATGVFAMMVSRRWGGGGFGMAEASHMLRLIAQADVCAAWNASF
jgi:3-hydroxy-9,10-secoandrosta-1,3,5(10)-triene-9,17-dione monooxygenase